LWWNNYDDVDECDNPLVAGPFVINVLPAPVPTISLPPIASPISCVDAASFVALDATFSNGLAGVCNISGTIAAGVDNNWDACGGQIVLHYFGFDDCGRYISVPPVMIDVQPAPVPTITPPVLPASLSCADAGTYMPPTGTYDNGLPGTCNLSGTADVIVNQNFDACGGTLEIIYFAEDDCGRNIPKNIQFIDVNPAPAPMINLPTFPATMSCSEAYDLMPLDVPYDNGLDGDCNISGFVSADVFKDVDACTGGTVVITYSGMDDCGNNLGTSPIVINVTPADPAYIELPQDASPIYCWEAPGYVPENAVYTNGESGFCKNSGELTATTVEPFWNNCDGGFFMIQYTGFDDCGNYLESDFIKIAVLPDTWAAYGECVNLEVPVDDIKNIPGPNDIDPYVYEVLADLNDYCGTMSVDIVGDSGVPACGLDGTFQRVYDLQVTDECGNDGDICTLTFYGYCNPLYCTLTEDFYSDEMENFGGINSIALIDQLIDGGNNPIVLGSGDCGITLDNNTCIQAALNGAGQSTYLPNGYDVACGNPINNNLANQVITTMLNIRYNAQVIGLDYGNFQIAAACIDCPAFIHNSLPGNATINDLIAYANDFLGCQCTGICGEYDSDVQAALTGIFLGLNSRFNKCHVPGPCFYTNVEVNESGNDFINPNFVDFANKDDRMGITLFPNPADKILNLKFHDENFIGQTGTVEIFNVQGLKVAEQKFMGLGDDLLQLDVNKLSDGVYWLTTSIKGFNIEAKRFVIVKSW